MRFAKCHYCHNELQVHSQGKYAGLCQTCILKMQLIQDMSDHGYKYFNTRAMRSFLEEHPLYKRFYSRLTG